MNKKGKLIVIISSLLVVSLIGVTQVKKYIENENNKKDELAKEAKEEVTIKDIIVLIEDNPSYLDIKQSKSELGEVIDNISDEKYISVFENQVSDMNKNLDKLINLFNDKRVDESSWKLLEILKLTKESLNHANDNIKLAKESNDNNKLETGLKGIMKTYLYLEKLEEAVEISSDVMGLEDEIKDIDKKDLSDIKIEEKKEEDESDNNKVENNEIKEEKEDIKEETVDNDEGNSNQDNSDEVDSYHVELYKGAREELMYYYPKTFMNDYKNGYLPEENFAIYYGEVQNLAYSCREWGKELWIRRECNNSSEKLKEEKYRLSIKKIDNAISEIWLDLDHHGDGADLDVDKLRSDLNECARIVSENINIVNGLGF